MFKYRGRSKHRFDSSASVSLGSIRKSKRGRIRQFKDKIYNKLHRRRSNTVVVQGKYYRDEYDCYDGEFSKFEGKFGKFDGKFDRRQYLGYPIEKQDAHLIIPTDCDITPTHTEHHYPDIFSEKSSYEYLSIPDDSMTSNVPAYSTKPLPSDVTIELVLAPSEAILPRPVIVAPEIVAVPEVKQHRRKIRFKSELNEIRLLSPPRVVSPTFNLLLIPQRSSALRHFEKSQLVCSERYCARLWKLFGQVQFGVITVFIFIGVVKAIIIYLYL